MAKPVTKFYIDDSSPADYMGAYTGEHEVTIPGTWAIISTPPPIHATQTTTDGGVTWSTYPPV